MALTQRVRTYRVGEKGYPELVRKMVEDGWMVRLVEMTNPEKFLTGQAPAFYHVEFAKLDTPGKTGRRHRLVVGSNPLQQPSGQYHGRFK